MSSQRPSERDERPLGELLSEVTTQLQTLLRKEVELAKTEIKQQLTEGAKGAAAFAVAGVIAFLGVIALVFAAAWGLATVMPEGVAFLIVSLLLLAVAGVLFNQGRKKLAQVSPVPEKTIETFKEDVQAAKDAVKQGMQESPEPSATPDYYERWRRY
jgi:CHASE3 domain sensor protein